ncbi:hypothetical protein [uncultured Zobellia sp.]|uniref:hypothetical protein n=1 Tax=uncultured Zobellia sp. TaxID=255433 RepID=UPI002592D631|nr:hypothetical protein [uncultured Zobellia sp.]
MEYNFEKYNILSEHGGTKNYDVQVILGNNYEIPQVLFNKETKELAVYGRTDPIDKKNKKSQRLKISLVGDKLQNGPTNARFLSDGTTIGFDYYSNWLFDGNLEKHDFINPITEKDKKDLDKWLTKFEELYHMATDVYVTPSIYDFYMKIDGRWHEINRNVKGVPIDLHEQFPAKYDKVRMVELRDLCPDFFKSRDKRDTSFVDIVGYEETDSEKGSGINPISYSAGNYYLNLYMPLGDTIKIKRHGSMGVNMQFYKIPVTQGGRNDVVFIVQEPNEMYPDRELGGMYVVRPRNLDQKQYGPHESSADSYAGQYDSIKRGTDPELKFLKPMED